MFYMDELGETTLLHFNYVFVFKETTPLPLLRGIAF